MSNERYWVIVASKNHVKNGVQSGIVQANHGKAAPLRRMSVGDGFLYYSPKWEFAGNEKLQAFTAIGRVTGESVYSFDMGGGFLPYRRDVEYMECQDAPIQPLIPALSFIENKVSWGSMFRYGFFEISKADFDLIASRMLKRKDAQVGS
jgi:hypothetical protein